MVNKQGAVTAPAMTSSVMEAYEEKGRLVPFHAERAVTPLDFDVVDKAVNFTTDNFVLSMFASQREDFKKFLNQMKSEMALNVKEHDEAFSNHISNTTFKETDINEMMLALLMEDTEEQPVVEEELDG